MRAGIGFERRVLLVLLNRLASPRSIFESEIPNECLDATLNGELIDAMSIDLADGLDVLLEIDDSRDSRRRR